MTGNYHYEPNNIVTAFKYIPPNLGFLSLSSSYLVPLATIPLLIICVCFCFILGLYCLLYAKASIHVYLPTIEIINERILQYIMMVDHRKPNMAIFLALLFLLSVAIGLVVNFIVFYGSAPLFVTLSDLQSTLVALNNIGLSLQGYINILSVNINQFISAKDSTACNAALTFFGLISTINTESSSLASSIGTISDILNALIHINNSLQLYTGVASDGSKLFISLVVVLCCLALIFLVMGFFRTTRRVLTTAIITGLFVVSFVSIINLIEFYSLVSKICSG